MAMLLKRLSRLEAQMDNAIEKFLFHHHVWGFLMIFIGIPLITLTAVCLFTAAIVFPLGVFSGLICPEPPLPSKAPQSGKAHILISS